MDMYSCPKWGGCNAPICPLDPDWKSRKHLDGEKACFYLAEFAKPTGKTILSMVLAGEHYEALARVYPEVMSLPTPLRNQLNRAKKESFTDRPPTREGRCMSNSDYNRERVINRLMKKPGLRSRIDAKCCECIYDPYQPGTWRKQVELCTSPTCPLFDVRPFSKEGVGKRKEVTR